MHHTEYESYKFPAARLFKEIQLCQYNPLKGVQFLNEAC